MRLKKNKIRGLRIAATCLIAYGCLTAPSFGDEPQSQGGSRLARLFRLGGSGGSSSNAPATANPNNGHNHDHASPAATVKPLSAATAPAGALITTPTAALTPPSTPDLSAGGTGHRITPHSRVSKPATEADPILTRVSIGRADNGSQFGMFMQVFADGTVIDGEGVHHVNPDMIKPLLETMHQGDIYRLKGHCGAPSADEIETAHVIVYERAYGKLRASSFSYSGNPHGCDPSLHKVHKALEAIQMKLSHIPPSNGVATTVSPTGTVVVAPAAAAPVLVHPAQVAAAPVAAGVSPMPHAPVVNPAPGAVLTLTPPNQ